MRQAARLAHLSLIAAVLAAAMPATVMARASSNIGHGVTCYTNPATGERVCFKRP